MKTEKLFQLNDKWYSTTDIQTFNEVIDSYYDKNIMEDLEQYNLKRMYEEEYFVINENKYLELHENFYNEKQSKILYEEEIEYLLDTENKVSYDLNDLDDVEKFNSQYEEQTRKAEVDSIEEELLFEDDRNLVSYLYGEKYKSDRQFKDGCEFDSVFQNTDLEYEHDVSKLMFQTFIVELEDNFDIIIKERNMGSEGYYDSEEDSIHINLDNGYTTNKRMMRVILHELSFEKEKISQKEILERIDFKRLIHEEEERMENNKLQEEWEENLFNDDIELDY